LNTTFFKETGIFANLCSEAEGHVLEDPKGGKFLPKKDIWSPYLGLIAKWKFRT
jgi:hypothetical protein